MRILVMQFSWRGLVPALLLAGLLGGGLAAARPMRATPDDTITLTAPNNVTIPESSEYATEVLRNPWDENDLDDISTPYHFSAVTLSNGIWQATTLGGDSFVMFQHQGFTGAYSWVGQTNGVNYPIPTTVFTHLRMRLNVSQHITNAVMWWYTAYGTAPVGNTRFIDLQPGWHIYDIDLPAGGPGANGSWSAQPLSGLRFDFPLAGTQVQFDWVRLTRPASTNVTISWTYTGSGSSTVNLYASADPSATGADEQLIASVPASSNSYTWTGAGLAPGTYYIHASMNGARAASGPLVIAPKPIVRIDAPSTWSGEDYAAARLSEIWNGGNAAQFPYIENVTPISYLGDYLQASATNNDPNIWWLAYDQAHAIDTTRYRYMNVRLWLQAPANSPQSWINAGPRMTWSVPLDLVWQQSAGVIAGYNRWLPIAFDMATVPIVGGGSGWSGQVTTWRFDPHEEDDANRNVLPPFFRIGGAHLTTQPMSNAATLIRWTPLQGSGSVDLYWDADNQGYNGTLIAANVPLGQGSYGWNTAGLGNGTYWVYTMAHDALGSISAQYSLAPVVVNHASPSTIFSDVPTNYFVANEINDLATRGIINGYAQPDSTVLFLPGNSTTRGQISKMIVLARGWTLVNPPTNTFADVPPSQAFYTFVETAASHGIISGYQCGGPGEPCDGQNRPYFRPGVNVTRGQTAKIIVLAFAWAINTNGGPHFTDVPATNSFYPYVETAYNRGIISGYADNTFRPGANVTRGQLSKMLSRSIASP